MNQRWITGLLATMLLGSLGEAKSLVAQGFRDGQRSEGSSMVRENLKRLDANGDGMIEMKEVPERARHFVEKVAKEAGLETDKPISMEKFQSALEKHDRDRSERRGDRGADRASESSTSSGNPQPAGSSSSAGEKSEHKELKPDAPPAKPSLVPGFGASDKLSKPPGFDVVPDYLKKSADGKVQSGFGGRGEAPNSGKVRRYAESLLKQYDSNGNGVLEKDEWQKMSGNPKAADVNGDGMITLDELADHLAKNGGGGSSGGGTSSGDSAHASSGSREEKPFTQSVARESSKGAVRFLSPTERLPKGLPDWFVRNDADGDGQISLAEFSSSLTADKLSEFNRYDRDGDGFVTPQEYLASEKDRRSSSSSSSRDSSR